MARRGENIYKRKDGRWEARYPKSSADGHIVYGYVYGQTYGEAKSKRTKLMQNASNPLHIATHAASEKILRDLANEWLTHKRKSVKEATYVRYRHLYEKHIDEHFGLIQLKKLDILVIEAHIREKQKTNTKSGLAPKTIQDILSVFRLLIAYGVEKKMLSPDNIHCLQKHSPYKITDHKVTVLLPKERTELERYVLKRNDIRSFGIFLALYTGLRIGELCALRWSDIDLNNGILHINYTLQRLHDYSESSTQKTKLILSTPKTEASARMIPLPSFLINRLSTFASSPDHFILTNTSKPEETRSYLYFYKKQLSSCGLPQYTFHAIRHTFATRCVEEGVDIKSLSEILGHSNVKITMNRYVHPSIETKRRCLEKLAVST
ncbi:MAG: site-specific integrase [Clostridia bacterium]|nr:site-specific integrase [Clostridia bacterium]